MSTSVFICLLVSTFVTTFAEVVFQNSECDSRSYGYDSVVCVCTGSRCDKIPRIPKPSRGSIVQITSSMGGLRFAQTTSRFETKDWQSRSAGPRIEVKRGNRYQEIIGFGGAFTDAATMNIMTLPKDAQEQLVRSYFANDGIEYNMGRVPIAGSDFSTHAYSYDDIPGDVKMSHFNLKTEDVKFKIPVIQQAMSVMPGPDELLLSAAAWSSPPWMKTSNRFIGFGLLKEEYYQAYADYHLHFLDSYAQHGLKFWSISTGNEPLNGIVPTASFNCLGWTPSRQSTWIRNNLGPSLRNSVHNRTKIISLDDQRILLHYWLDWLLENNDTLNYVDGIGVHWYTDLYTNPNVLEKVHKKFPNKFLLYTEACVGSNFWEHPKVILGSWSRAELLVNDMISVLNRWVTGWIDWNLALDIKGGPNWAKNNVDSPIIVNATSGEFYKQPMFYALGHFSKFIPRGSVRIDAKASIHYSSPLPIDNQQSEDEIGFATSMVPLTVAFKQPDGVISLIIFNKFNLPMKVELIDDQSGAAELEIPARSISTVLYI